VSSLPRRVRRRVEALYTTKYKDKGVAFIGIDLMEPDIGPDSVPSRWVSLDIVIDHFGVR